MCGIAGLFDRSVSTVESDLAAICRRMTQAIQHRGPDDSGCWTDAAHGVALGHRRLSILDPSPQGHQPMSSSSGRFVMTFNGELYNFRELRVELERHGARFRGTSDTEVLLEAIERWGIEETLPRLNGMFAIGLWDGQQRRLSLVRDRFGEKPLYFADLGARVVFASELFALRECPWNQWRVDRAALAAFTRDLCVPAPLSILEHTRKLCPGTMVSFDFDSRSEHLHVYWSAGEAAAAAAANRFKGTFEDATSELERCLRKSARARMVADVPLGALLSGGIDSSAVVACMAAESSQPIRTFSIGVTDRAYDEAPYARRVAERLGTVHTEHYVGEAEIMSAVQDVVGIYDEPFADSSQVPTLLVSRMARSAVSVALTGDGGDELFGGYSRYDVVPRMWDRLARVPSWVRRRSPVGTAARYTPSPILNSLFRGSARLRGYEARFPDRSSLFARVDAIAAAPSLEALYELMLMQWKDPQALVPQERAVSVGQTVQWKSTASPIERLMLHDTVRYLPDDLLVKVDRAAMSVALETRLPFLDPDLFALAWSLPLDYRRANGEGKRVLKAVLERYLPAELVRRPKMGFSIPIGRWLTGPLRDWAEELLDERRLRTEGFFDVAAVRSAWERHLSRESAWSHEIWIVLQFQAWYESFRRDAAARPVS